MHDSTENEAVSKSFDATKSSDTSSDNGKQSFHLQDSEFTADSSENEQESSGVRWLGGMGTDFLNCLTENVSPVVSGVATLVHQTAVAVANEIAQLERDSEIDAEAGTVTGTGAGASEATEKFVEDSKDSQTPIGRKGTTDGGTIIISSSSFDSNASSEAEYLTLPWEIRQEAQHDYSVDGDKGEIPVYITDMKLMKRIFTLSREESTFLEPFSDISPETNVSERPSLSSYSSTFVMNEPRLKLIRRLLDIDKNLAAIHSRFKGKANFSDNLFWKNYFFHCEEVRAEELNHRLTETTTSSDRPSKLTNQVGMASSEERIDVTNTKGCDEDDHDGDDSSLVPAGSDLEEQSDDDSSYVFQSPPNTGESFATMRSVDDDLVLVDTQVKMKGRSPNRNNC